MTSYQRRKEEIAYLRQLAADYRAAALTIAALVPKGTPLPLGEGIAGDAYLNEVTSGEFWSEVAAQQS